MNSLAFIYNLYGNLLMEKQIELFKYFLGELKFDTTDLLFILN